MRETRATARTTKPARRTIGNAASASMPTSLSLVRSLAEGRTGHCSRRPNENCCRRSWRAPTRWAGVFRACRVARGQLDSVLSVESTSHAQSRTRRRSALKESSSADAQTASSPIRAPPRSIAGRRMRRIATRVRDSGRSKHGPKLLVYSTAPAREGTRRGRRGERDGGCCA